MTPHVTTSCTASSLSTRAQRPSKFTRITRVRQIPSRSSVSHAFPLFTIADDMPYSCFERYPRYLTTTASPRVWSAVTLRLVYPMHALLRQSQLLVFYITAFSIISSTRGKNYHQPDIPTDRPYILVSVWLFHSLSLYLLITEFLTKKFAVLPYPPPTLKPRVIWIVSINLPVLLSPLFLQLGHSVWYRFRLCCLLQTDCRPNYPHRSFCKFIRWRQDRYDPMVPLSWFGAYL